MARSSGRREPVPANRGSDNSPKACASMSGCPRTRSGTGQLERRHTLVDHGHLAVGDGEFVPLHQRHCLLDSLAQAKRGIPLTEASLLSSMPSWGMVVTLVGWGYVLDRVGERVVLTLGSALTAAAAYAAASVHSMVSVGVYLFLGGMAAASCNAAGGRLVSAWFPPHQRGLAMGIRQTAQPLGIAVGALVIPELAEHGLRAGLMFPALVCTVSAVASAIGIIDPPRKSRKSGHRAGTGQPVPRIVGAVANPRGGGPADDAADRDRDVHAGVADEPARLVGRGRRRLVTCHSYSGRWAASRSAAGRTDRLANATGPHHRHRRRLDLFLLALADEHDWLLEVPLMIAISVIAVLDNGLEATAITEFAGPFWSGRALGVQNTTQRLMAAAGPPLFGALIDAAKYPAAWALCGLFPLVAVPLVPAELLPPGLETTARLRSVRRLRWWTAVRRRGSPDTSRRPGPPGQRRRPRQDGQAAAPPT